MSKTSRKFKVFVSGVDAGGITSWSVNTVNALNAAGQEAELLVYRDLNSIWNFKADSRLQGLIPYSVIEYSSLDKVSVQAKHAADQSGICSESIVISDGLQIMPQIAWLTKPLMYCDVVHGMSMTNAHNAMRTLPYVDRCICVSESVRRSLLSLNESKAFTDRVRVSEPGVDVFADETPQSTQSEKVQLCYVGRIAHVEKRVFDIVDFCKELRRIGVIDQCHFNVYGDGSDREELKQRVSSDGFDSSVTFHGWFNKDDLYQAYRQQDFILSFSEAEGFALNLLEAMAHRVIPITTDVGGASRVITDGVNGYLFEPGDIARAAEKLAELIADSKLSSQMASLATERVTKNFSLRSHAERIVEACEPFDGIVEREWPQQTGRVRKIVESRFFPNPVCRLIKQLRRIPT